MAKGCNAFISAYDEELEKSLVNRKSEEAAIQWLCYEKTGVCSGVDPTNVPRFDNKILVDNEPMNIVEN